MIEPLRIEFTIASSAGHAFQVWTEHISDWWPTNHTVSAELDIAVVLEPRLSGRIFERTHEGHEFDWGEITAWEPPHRLGYRWHISRDRADATDVAITFTPVGPATTRVEIVHTGWERLGEDGQDWRDRNRGGWDGVLPHFIEHVERA